MSGIVIGVWDILMNKANIPTVVELYARSKKWKINNKHYVNKSTIHQEVIDETEGKSRAG